MTLGGHESAPPEVAPERPPTGSRRGMRRWLVAGGIALVLGLLAMLAAPRLLSWLRPGPPAGLLSASGRIEGRITTLTPKTGAWVMALHVDEGQAVRQGQLLATLDDRAQRERVRAAEEQVNALFKSTLAQSKVSYGDFQELHPSYFARILDGMGEKAQFMLCWQGEQLLSFQLSLISKDRVLAKQIGMKYPEARELNLYFVNWLKLIEYAIDHRIPSIEMGATTYATKLLFGGHLERRWLHFRFRGAVANRRRYTTSGSIPSRMSSAATANTRGVVLP